MTMCLFFFRSTFWVVAMVVFCCLPALTAEVDVIDLITQDFKPLSGYVVKVAGNEYIIDLDQASGISRGEIFSVLGPGEKIVHPVTQKVIGTLDKVKGILKVTRLKKGYSFARPVGESADIKPGDLIRRYENIPAVFWDYTDGKGRQIATRLQNALPDMNWREYEDAQRSKPPEPAPPKDEYQGLIFIFLSGSLEVRDPDFILLRTYLEPESLSVIGRPLSAPSEGSSQAPAAGQDVLYSAVFRGTQTIGNLSGLTVMADFVKYNGQLLMAATNSLAIEVFEVGDNLVPLTKAVTPVPSQILTLKWWYPKAKGPLLLTVTSWSDERIAGIFYKFEENKLVPLPYTVPRILGTFDLDADGRPETLLGQAFDGKTFFGSSIKELRISNGKVKNFNFNHVLPRRFTVVGSQIADLTVDGKPESAFVRSGILYIHHGKENLFTSAKEMGGSLSIVTYDINIIKKDPMTDSVTFEVSPVAADIDGDGQLELVTVASDRSSFRIPGVVQDAKKSQLVVFKYRDGRFVKGVLGGKIEGPLQGLAVANSRVLFVLSQPGSVFGKDGHSHLLGYPLAKK